MAFNPNRILLAEDDERARNLLSHYLRKWEFSVLLCRDGAEAAAMLEQDNAPSIALIDWEMPGMEGIEICRQVRARAGRRPYTYLILLTARSDKGEVAAGLQAGADDYVTKPFDADELLARIKVGQRVVSLERRLAEYNQQLRDALDQISALHDAANGVQSA